MYQVNKQQLVDILKKLGVQPGDGLLIHSAIQFLGRPTEGIGIFLEAIKDTIGPQGTIVVPTFNFGFAHGEHYDPQKTPSKDMGAFSEYVRQRPEALRTSHPMQSIAIIGRYAADLAGRDTAGAFDPGSAFERMLELGFKLLLLGADARAISMFHYSERLANVPYRYWKDFSGEVRTPDGWQTHTYTMFVRDLDMNPQLTLEPVVEYMKNRNEWHSLPLNYGWVTVCTLQDFVSAANRFLADDPWSLVTNRESILKSLHSKFTTVEGAHEPHD